MKRILRTLKEKWPEYVFEILVITIGILGAFSLNSWKQASDNEREVRKALENMLSELQEDSIQFQSHIRTSEALLSHARTVIDIIQSDSVGNLEYHYSRARGYNLFVPSRSAFESMNQLGLLASVSDMELLGEIQYYYNYTQFNIKLLREFEERRYQEKMNAINTNAALVMEEAGWDDLPLDYAKVKQILLEPDNFKRIYDFIKTEEFLINRANGYIQINTNLINQVRGHLEKS